MMLKNISENPDVTKDDLIPEFRVVVVNKKRRGVRLEKLYWNLLAEIANRRGEKRSRLIASVIERLEGDSNNIASMLRGFVAKTLDDDRQENVGQNLITYQVDLLQQAPVPAFSLNRQKKLYQVNQEFIQILRVLVGNMTEKISADVVQLTLDTPTEKLFMQLMNSASCHCNYVIQLDGRQRQGKVKIVAVPPSPYKMLVGYIVT